MISSPTNFPSCGPSRLVVPPGNSLPVLAAAGGDQTARLQAAIDDCARRGGGRVELGPGRFETGTLHLRSGVELHLGAGALLAASSDPSRFPILERRALRLTGDDHGVRSLIFGLGLRDAALTGPGEICATAEGFLRAAVGDQTRPRGVHLEDCEGIRMEGLRLRDACFWMVLVLGCRRVDLSGLSIWNHAMPNSDGIDIVGSSDVRIEKCVIDTDDDGICLKSGAVRATRRIRVTDCRVFTHCNALKVGTETNSDVEDLVFEDCELGASAHEGGLHFGSPHGLSGICLGMVDGGSLRRAAFRRIRMSDFESPIFVKVGTRDRPIPGDGRPEVREAIRREISEIRFEDIACHRAGSFGSMFLGLPEGPIRGVTLRNVRVEVVRPCALSPHNLDLKSREKEYPDCRHFGPSPAWGLFAAGAKDLVCEECHFTWARPDGRLRIVDIA